MPSGNKTLNLALNKWLGSDKPKKDDFNGDNQKIDDAFGEMSSRVDGISGDIASSINAHAGNTAIHVTSAEKTGWNSASSHVSNTTVHVTAAEKQTWSKSTDLVVGYYTGNGNTSQKITLGYKPRFGLIFAVDEGMGRVNWVGTQFWSCSGCMTQHGSSLGVTLSSDGFTVEHSVTGGIDGFSKRLNGSGVRYAYFIWK